MRGGRRVSLCQLDGAAHAAGGSHDGGGLERLSDGFEFIRRIPRRFDVAGGERDRGAGGKQPCAAQTVPGVLRERALDAGGGGADVTFSEVKHGEPGLGHGAKLLSHVERLTRCRVVAQAQADLAELCEAFAGEHRRPGAQLLAGAAYFFLGVGPGAAEAHDLGPIHAAVAGETGDGLALAPAPGSFGPLAGAAIVGEVTTSADHVAVDGGSGRGTQLAAHSRDGRLFQQCQSLIHFPLRDQDDALLMKSDGLEVAVRKASPDLKDAAGIVQSLVKPAVIDHAV